MRTDTAQGTFPDSSIPAEWPYSFPIRASIRILAAIAVTLSLFAFTRVAQADGPRHPGRYVPPASSYILDPTETPIIIQFGSTELSDIQARLDAARATDADSPIVLTLTGSYWVKEKPLSLPSKTSLILYGTIQAFPGATASSLISVSGQSKVAIAGGILQGNLAHLAGIDVEASTMINIDSVTIINTGRDGIILSGNGNTVFDSGSAITRCDVSGSRGNGITIQFITQTLLLDNFVHNNQGDGIQLNSARSSVVNNSLQHNDVGLLADANNNLITDNDMSENRQGLQLTATSSDTAVMRNSLNQNQANGIDFDGTNNLVFGNTLSNRTNLTDRSSTNWVVAHGTPLNATFSQYFYPPTMNNQHLDPIMNGRGRIDVTVTSEDITAVQQAYDNARQQNQDSVIVLHMNGDFTLDGTAALTLGSYTAVVLNGNINVTSNTVANAITDTNPASFVSISGGTIDLNGRGGAEGIFFPSTTMAYIDQVAIINAGQPDMRNSDGEIHLQHGGGYNILYRNTVNESGGRCIWTQFAAAHYVVLENHLSNCNMDAVDFDSATSNSYVIDNMSIDNRRYGVFVEQSDSYNTIYGNFTSDTASSSGHGVGVYNNATGSGTRAVTDGNTVFSNISNVIANGLRVGSISSVSGGVAESAHTFMFNNIVKNSTGNGILFDTEFPDSIDNYFSQNVFSGNKINLDAIQSNGATPPDFFNPISAINLALNRPVTASSTAPGSDPANAVDGLAFTGWTSNDQSSSWLAVDLGTDASFQRVMLKQTSVLGIDLVTLQSSEDGVNFTDVPSGVAILGSVGTLRFAPVSARYVRLKIWSRFGSGNGIQEMAIFPE
jgi:F5/8 type C domain-containing protein/parallel beta helix pectate lyase-like protein